jgi:hypothetical protein
MFYAENNCILEVLEEYKRDGYIRVNMYTLDSGDISKKEATVSRGDLTGPQVPTFGDALDAIVTRKKEQVEELFQDISRWNNHRNSRQ